MNHTLLRVLRPAVVVAALLSIGLGVATAQPSNMASATASNRELRAAITSKFRVLPVQNGIILVPLVRIAGVDNIELRDGTIAVNGTVVSGAELRQRLASDASGVLQLSYMDLAEQKRLLLPEEGVSPGAQKGAAEREHPTPQPPATSSDRPGDTPEVTEPEAPSRPRRIHRNGETRFRFGGSINVAQDEEVDGPVVTVGGSVDVDGLVRDNVVAVGGDVRLGPHADVRGDVTVVGGQLTRDPASTVQGHVNEIGFDSPGFHIRPIHWAVPFGFWDGTPWRTVRFFGTLLRVVLFGLVAALVLVLAPRAVERTDYAITTQPLKAGLIGLVAQLFFIPLLVMTVVLLLVSIIGIPLLALVPFAVLLFVVLWLLGFTAAATSFGRLLKGRFNTHAHSSMQLLLLGLIGIWGLILVGRLLGIGGGPLTWAGGVIVLMGFLVEFAAWTLGLGGALMTRFGRRGRLYPVAVDPTIDDLDLGGPGTGPGSGGAVPPPLS